MAGSPTSAVSRERVSDVVARRLEDLIYRDFQAGDRLPAESALAQELGVSRLTVREATRSLQARGLIAVSRGSRPVVAQLTGEPVENFFSSAVRRDPRRLLDLLEVRRALEVQAAELAATRAGRAVLLSMQASLDAMRESPDDPAAFNEADVRFHESVAAASGNHMLSLLVEALAEPMRISRMRSLAGHHARGIAVETTIDQHALILEAIAARDPNRAVAAMQAHLVDTERDLQAALTLGD